MVLKHGKGWLTDLPDIRDYTPYSEKIDKTFRPLQLGPTEEQPEPKSQVDNRQWCTPIKNQMELSSCTAFAAVGMLEYLEKKVHNKFLEGSELFVYKLTRYLMSTRNELSNSGLGDTGAFIRSVLGALVYFGVPPAESYPYIAEKLDAEPPTKIYILAQNYQILEYFRLDHNIKDPLDNLNRIRRWVTLGFPVEFGFTCYRSTLQQAETTGNIPYPHTNDTAEGGHAIMICGYDDNKVIGNKDNGKNTTGAFLIRNSWGTEWGDNGYGFLPYEYILSGQGLAQDFWTIVKNEFIDKDLFHW